MQTDSPNSVAGIAGAASAGLGAVPLFHAAWLFAAGIAVAHWLWIPPSMTLLALALVAVLCGVAAFGAQRMAWMPLAVLWLALGAWCAEVEPQPALASNLAGLSDGLMRTVEGVVVDAGPIKGQLEENLDHKEQGVFAAEQKPSQRVDLRVENMEVVTDADDAQAPVQGGLRLAVRWTPTKRPTRLQRRFTAENASAS